MDLNTFYISLIFMTKIKVWIAIVVTQELEKKIQDQVIFQLSL